MGTTISGAKILDGKFEKTEKDQPNLSGVNVMITIFGDFRKFFEKKYCVFL
jgi:hypothetical protein